MDFIRCIPQTRIVHDVNGVPLPVIHPDQFIPGKKYAKLGYSDQQTRKDKTNLYVYIGRFLCIEHKEGSKEMLHFATQSNYYPVFLYNFPLEDDLETWFYEMIDENDMSALFRRPEEENP